MAKSTKTKAPIAFNAEKVMKKLGEPIPESVVAWAEEFKEDFDKQIEILAPSKPAIVEEKTEEQSIVDYIKNAHSEKVDLVPVLKSFYPLPTFASRPKYLMQGESKRLKGLLSKMVSDGLIQLADDQYLKLGKFYYVDKQTETMYWNIDTLKIFAKK